MRIIYRKSTGAVVMYTEGDIQFDLETLAAVDYEPTVEEIESFKQNRPALFTGGKLDFRDNVADVIKKKKINRDALLKLMTDKKKSVDERFDALAELIKNIDSQ